MRFPTYSLTFNKGPGTWRLQFDEDKQPLILRQAIGDTMTIVWSLSRGQLPMEYWTTVAHARAVMDHHGWPTRVDIT